MTATGLLVISTVTNKGQMRCRFFESGMNGPRLKAWLATNADLKQAVPNRVPARTEQQT